MFWEMYEVFNGLYPIFLAFLNNEILSHGKMSSKNSHWKVYKFLCVQTYFINNLLSKMVPLFLTKYMFEEMYEVSNTLYPILIPFLDNNILSNKV